MSQEDEHRRLSAIMFTDMVGYSALAQRNEALALALIREQQQLLRPLFAQHGGREVKGTGDGFLVEFASALQAARCAIEIQKAIVDRNTSEASERHLRLRIGLHLGDVEVRDGDVFGDGVNIAARIEPLAEPGGICVSRAVYEQIRNKVDLPLVRLQRPQLKNIQAPIDVYRMVLPWQPSPSSATRRPWRSVPVVVASLCALAAGFACLALWRMPDRQRSAPAGSAAPMPAGDTLTGPGFGSRPAIAVLPFDNLSPDPEQAFFADGLAEDLITRLSSWRAFPVIARNSSFQYRGGNRDLKRVSAELGARYLVEGSVRRSGDRIRVTAQLIDAPSGKHVWAETYDREVKDIFAVQDEISSIIAATIAGDLSRAEGERARRRGTENLEAWSLYEIGLQRSYQYSREANTEARHLFERAVALDPDFATALAALSFTYSSDVNFCWTDTLDQSVAAALDIARRAVALDPRDPSAQAALANAYLAAGDVHAGLDAARRAVDLNPSMPEAWSELGWAQLLSGDPEGCITANQHAQRLNPQGEIASLVWDDMALADWEMGRFDASLDAAHRLIAMRPDNWWGQVYLALNAVALRRPDEAHAAIAAARRLQPDLTIAKIQRALGVSRPEIDARRDAALREAGLE